MPLNQIHFNCPKADVAASIVEILRAVARMDKIVLISSFECQADMDLSPKCNSRVRILIMQIPESARDMYSSVHES